MEQIFIGFVNMSITASYVIVAVMLARVLMGRLPKKYSYWLWTIVGVRLVCPVSVSSVFSIFNLGKFKGNVTTSGQMTYVPDNIGIMAKPEVNVGVTSANAVINQVLPAPQMETVTSINPMQVWLFVGAWVWIIGIAIILICGIVSYIKARKMVSKAVIYSGNRHGVPEKIKIYECDNIGSPFVLGVIVPKIYVPFRMSETELNYILQHEFYHVRRKDHLIKLLAFVLAAVYWFNPLVWVAHFLFNRDMEMSCDENVLSKLGGAVKKDYSSLLLAFAINRRIGFGVLAFGEGDISKRVKNVLNFKNPKLWMGIAGIVLVIVLAVCCLTNAKEKEESVVIPTGQSVYKMVTANENLFWTPGITLDSDEGTFTFGYSMLSSYMNYGSYEILGDKLIARTSDGQYHFTFRVIDEETLEFVENESSKLHQFEDEKAFWVTDGAIFKCGKVSDSGLHKETTDAVIGEHLLFAETFEWANQNGGMNGFMLSEKAVDGEVFYCLKENTKSVEILVDAECIYARVITDKFDKKIDLPARVHFGGTNDGGYFHLLDLTGDGTDELIYVYGGGGTGAWSGGVDIYNLADMTKYAIEDESDMIYQIESSVDVELLYMDGDKSALCKITAPDGNESVMRMTAWGDKSVKLEDFAIIPDGKSGVVAYDVLDKSIYGQEGLSVNVGIDMSDVCMPGSYLGNVEYWLVYDEKDNIFRLGDYVWSDFSHYENTVDLEIKGYSGKGLPQSEKEWIIEFTNKLETVDISYLHDVTFQKINKNGEWEEVASAHGICGMMDPLKAGETVEIAVRPEWFSDMKPGMYQMGVLYSIEVGESEYENLWYYESVEIFK